MTTDPRITTVTELDARTPDLSEKDLGDVARGLQEIHDNMVAQLGDVYVHLSASWQGRGGKLVTLSYGTVDPDDEDDDASCGGNDA